MSRYHAILASVARPARRELAKEWSLSRQRESNRFPSFDEVLSVLKGSDGWRDDMEGRVDGADEDDRLEAEDAAAESGAARPPEGVWSSEWEEAVAAELERALEGGMVDDQRSRYGDVVADVESSDGQDCWREITLRRDVDPQALRSVGRFWADSESAAEAQWGRFGPGMRKVLLRARMDLGNIDLAGTVHARMDMKTGDEEREVRFLRHAPVWVYDALADGTVVEINAWRRA